MASKVNQSAQDRTLKWPQTSAQGEFLSVRQLPAASEASPQLLQVTEVDLSAMFGCLVEIMCLAVGLIVLKDHPRSLGSTSAHFQSQAPISDVTERPCFIQAVYHLWLVDL